MTASAFSPVTLRSAMACHVATVFTLFSVSLNFQRVLLTQAAGSSLEGSLLAAGVAGMAEGFDEAEEQEAVPAGAGDFAGNGAERREVAAVELEAGREDFDDDMSVAKVAHKACAETGQQGIALHGLLSRSFPRAIGL